MKKNHNRLLIMVSATLCLYLTSSISAMQMGGFDIDVGNGENSSWQWQEEQQWNQSSWENTWENSWQTGDNTSETPAQNDQTQDNEYPYNSDTGNRTQDNTQQWNDIQQSSTDWNNGSQWNILSGIIIPGVITPLKITITPRAIIILHGITILKRITTYRLHPRQINPMLKHQKKSH